MTIISRIVDHALQERSHAPVSHLKVLVHIDSDDAFGQVAEAHRVDVLADLYAT